jgi:hypothetical protein
MLLLGFQWALFEKAIIFRCTEKLQGTKSTGYMLRKNNRNTLNGGDHPKGIKKISMAASNHIDNRSKKKSFLDIVTLIRSIQRAEGNMDCFQMGVIDCDQVDCKWRAFCLEVYPIFGKDKI